jgi:hypothetical protein
VHHVLAPQARLLFRTALLLFVVTIVIGILNGLDIWEPPHNVLLTHVHAGTLGWITLAFIGAVMLMFSDGADARAQRTARNLAATVAFTTVIYVFAFYLGTGIFRPIAGTLELIAIVWALIWVSGRFRQTATTTARLAALLAVISLTIGAVLGVLLGLLIARGSLPGLSAETASAIAGAHPPAMLIGYLILAGVAVTHWVLGGGQGVLGKLVAWLLFVAGIIANVSLIFDIEALVQVFSLLEVVAIILYIVHMWPQVGPGRWAGEGTSNFARMAVVFLVVGIGLLVYVVQLFISGQLDPETGEGPVGVLLAFDHSMFVGVMTNALFASIGVLVGTRIASRLVIWSVNIGLTVFLVGLTIDNSILKRIGAPLMGVALLYGIYVFFMEMRPRGPAAA